MRCWRGCTPDVKNFRKSYQIPTDVPLLHDYGTGGVFHSRRIDRDVSTDILVRFDTFNVARTFELASLYIAPPLQQICYWE